MISHPKGSHNETICSYIYVNYRLLTNREISIIYNFNVLILLDHYKEFEIYNKFPENSRGIARHYKCNVRLLWIRIQVRVLLTMLSLFYYSIKLTAAGALVLAHTSQTLADGPVLAHALARLLHQSVDTFCDWLALLLFRHLKVSPSDISVDATAFIIYT